MVWSPDGKRIASGGYNKTVQVWDAKSGHLYLTYRGHYSYVFAVAWSPDGTRIVSATGAAGPDHPVTSNNSVKVWDATTGKTLLTYAGDADQVEMYALAWSPDSKRIASGGDDKMVHIWDAATGHTSLLNQGHTDLVWAVAWSPDGKELASASQDGTVEVWHVV